MCVCGIKLISWVRLWHLSLLTSQQSLSISKLALFVRRNKAKSIQFLFRVYTVKIFHNRMCHVKIYKVFSKSRTKHRKMCIP